MAAVLFVYFWLVKGCEWVKLLITVYVKKRGWGRFQMMVLTQVMFLRFFCSPTPTAPTTTLYIIAYALSWLCSSSLCCFAATHASFGSIIVEGHSLVTTVAVFSIWRWHDYHPCRWLQSRVRQVMDVSLWPEMTGDNRGCERMQRTPFHIRQNMPSTKWIHYSKDGHPQRTRDCNTVIIVIIDVLYLGNWRQHIAILDLFAPEISKLIWNGISSILELRVMLRGFKRNMSVLSLRCAVPPVITWFLSWGYHPIVLQS